MELRLTFALREDGRCNDGSSLACVRVAEQPDLLVELLDLFAHLDDRRHRIPLPRDKGIHERIEGRRLVLRERTCSVVEKVELGLPDVALRVEALALCLQLLDRGRILYVLLVRHIL